MAGLGSGPSKGLRIRTAHDRNILYCVGVAFIDANKNLLELRLLGAWPWLWLPVGLVVFDPSGLLDLSAPPPGPLPV